MALHQWGPGRSQRDARQFPNSCKKFDSEVSKPQLGQAAFWMTNVVSNINKRMESIFTFETRSACYAGTVSMLWVAFPTIRRWLCCPTTLCCMTSRSALETSSTLSIAYACPRHLKASPRHSLRVVQEMSLFVVSIRNPGLVDRSVPVCVNFSGGKVNIVTRQRQHVYVCRAGYSSRWVEP